jgi:lysyl-tRNA synthetase class 1
MSDKMTNNSWPFVEARQILERINNQTPSKGYVLFETGYGPSGLPHIGTFGEVARTTMVRHAFQSISDIPTRLFSFSDDMDGLRKVPDNIPQQEMVRQHIGKPLTSIPDPYGTHESYGAYMNAKLRSFLDQFGFEYEFKSATECYKSGMFDQALVRVLEKYDEVMNVMLPSLGEERQATYSPFLPICPETGVVLQVPITSWDVANATISYNNSNGEQVTTSIKGGKCKLQWKADWAMRWFALGVDYEMHGKDLIPTAILSSQICEIMGGKSPILFRYELFLDEKGQKISKSKGNGISMDEWLRYAPTESLALYMYQSPTKAKRLFFDVIPKQVDNYITYNEKYQEGDYDNPLWHIHQGAHQKFESYGLNFSLLLNLATVCNPQDKTILWGFISQYAPQATAETAPFLDRLVYYAMNYYDDFIKPNKQFRVATDKERILLEELVEIVESLSENLTAEEIQNRIYALGVEYQLDLKQFFQALYEILLGQSQGPRLGSFIKLYGISKTAEMIRNRIQ